MEIIYNALLQIRLWFYTMFYPKKFINDRKIEKDDYALIFSDEFELGYLDRTKWESYPNWGRIHPDYPNKYCDDNNSIVQDNLKLISDNADFNITEYGIEYHIDYTFGLIENYKFVSQLKNTLGYYEIRCKIPNTIGVWPSFWLWPINSWPPEIDIFEFWPTEKCNWFNTNYHWIENGVHKQKAYTHHFPLMNLSENFHLYGLEWTETYMKFYFDGVLIRKIYVSDITPMRLVINNNIDSEKTKNEQLPSIFEVDWVRYYQKNQKLT